MKATALAAAAVLVALATALWVSRDSRDALRAEFEERVAPLESLEDFYRPPIPDHKNVAAGMREVVEWLHKHDANSPIGRPTVVTDFSLWKDAEEEERALRATYLKSIEPAFELLEEALQREQFQTTIDFRKGPSAGVTEYRRLSELSTLLIALAREGDVERGCRLLLKLAERFESPFFWGHSLRQQAKQSAVVALSTAPAFDAIRIRRALDPLLAAALPPTGPPTRPIEQERAFWVHLTQNWGQGLSLGGELYDEQLGWRDSPVLYRDSLQYLDLVERAVSSCHATPREALQVAEQFGGDDSSKLLSVLTVNATLRRHFLNYAELAASLRLARVGLAVLESRQQTAKWPEALPKPKLIDPFSGRSFVYERDGERVLLRAAAKRDWESLADVGLAWALNTQ